MLEKQCVLQAGRIIPGRNTSPGLKHFVHVRAWLG